MRGLPFFMRLLDNAARRKVSLLCIMITFSSQKILNLVSRKRTATTVNYALFSCILILALACAALTPDSDKHFAAFVSCWSLLAAFLLVFAFINIFYVRKVTRDLKSAVAAVIAEAFGQSEHILQGERNIELTISADGDILSVARKGYKSPVTISATGGGLKTDGNLQFDLQDLKRVGSAYSAAGDYIWQYLNAYYFKNGQTGQFENVSVDDRTADKPQILPLVQSGVPVQPNPKNVYMK